MSKKKETSTEPDQKVNLIDSIYNEITKDFGIGIVKSVDSFLENNKKQVIPFSPSFDIGLGGGIPEGTWVTFTGKPKSGKSTSILHFAAKTQLPEYGSRDVFYFDIEGRFKEMNLTKAINKDKFHIFSSVEGKILTAQDFLTIAEKIICTVPRSVIVLDSISALCTETEFNSGLDEMQRADGPKLLAKFCRKMANRIPVNRSIVLAVTHLMANPSGYGSPLQEKSGNAVAYQMDVKLKAKSHEYWTVPSKQKPIGQIVSWVVETSALGPPGGQVTSYIRYGDGIDELTELITLGTDLGLITKGGAWYSCPFLAEYVKDYDEKQFKFQGQEKLYEFFNNNPDLTKYLDAAFHKIIG